MPIFLLKCRINHILNTTTESVFIYVLVFAPGIFPPGFVRMRDTKTRSAFYAHVHALCEQYDMSIVRCSSRKIDFVCAFDVRGLTVFNERHCTIFI